MAAGKRLAVVSNLALTVGIRSLLLHLDESGITGSNRWNCLGSAWYPVVANVWTKSKDARLSRFDVRGALRRCRSSNDGCDGDDQLRIVCVSRGVSRNGIDHSLRCQSFRTSQIAYHYRRNPCRNRKIGRELLIVQDRNSVEAASLQRADGLMKMKQNFFVGYDMRLRFE